MEEKDKVENIENNILNEEAVLKGEKQKAKEIEKDIAQTGKLIVGEAKVLEERKKKIINFTRNNPSFIFYVILVFLIILGIYIRIQPLLDHNGTPGLWDITTKDYTLGPDLDPFLFLRYARTMIENGSLPQIDTMRNVPLFFDTTTELQMVSYMIVLTYKVVNLFGSYSINFAGAFMPVIFFALTVIAFFFFVREIFIRNKRKESEIKAGIIASISTLFMIIMPSFLSRTIAGIPEKESIGFFFMFLSFYLFLMAWKSEKKIAPFIIATLSGVSTALMGLSWGGVSYAYVTISVACILAFLLNKIKARETLIYSLWIISSLAITLIFSNRYSITGFVTSLDTGIASLALLIFIVHLILWETKIKDLRFINKMNLPKNILSIIITIIIGILGSTIVFGPNFIIEKIDAVNHMLFTPITGRWNTTVAENRQPYFTEWADSLGPIIKNIPVLFWLFLIGSIVLFKQMINRLKKKDAWILTLTYLFFLFGLIFSRYSSSSTFNGENFISKLFYYSSALILICVLVYYYLKYHKEKDNSMELLSYEYIFLFSLLILSLFTARSAVRLIMVIAIIAPIFVSYLLTWAVYRSREENDSTIKIILIAITIVIIALVSFSAWNYYNEVKQQAYYTIPSYYTTQWQNAMAWVRENTSSDSVFAHWWDYGYWVQSIGNRATVTDGGNAITWWNYLMGRFVLTGNNQKDALEFLYAHNATYLLIDSTDIGKYGAFSQIGSDGNFDRLSQGPITFLQDSKQTEETKYGKKVIYDLLRSDGNYGIASIEEDITYEINGTKEVLFKENYGIMGVSIEVLNNNQSVSFKQPEGIFYSNAQQKKVPMRYVYFNNQLFDFKSGINATIYIIPRVSSSSIDYMGAAIYLSPRVMRGLLGQVYILNNSLGNFDSFELVHSQPDLFTENLEQQGYPLADFSYFDNGAGLQGPIKIWKINYVGNEKFNPDYLLKVQPAYITWKF
jgi:asparagine N-glycosylation enzyme membrane subunit Stt3